MSARGGSPSGDRAPGRASLPGERYDTPTPAGFERTLRQDELRADGRGAPDDAQPGDPHRRPPAAAAADPGPGAGDDMFADLYLDFDDLADAPGAPAAAHAHEPAPRATPAAPAPPPPPEYDATVPSVRALPADPPAVPPPPEPVAAPPAPPAAAPPAAPPVAPPAAPPAPPAAEPEGDIEATSRTDSVARRRDQDARPGGADVEVQASAWSAASHPGRRRAVRRERLGLGTELTARDNDDRYAATGSVFVVADGLGGHPSGWYAADVACRTLVADLAAADLSAGWSDRLRAAIAVADLAVRRHGHGQTYEGMRTTVVAAVVQEGRLHLAGCGDSVCWLVRGGAAFRLTEQGNAADLGRPWLLTSTPLGGSQQPDPELQRIELHPGDRVVLATDGVGHLADETVADLIHGDPFHAATTLTVTAVQSGDDDATAVVIECEALPVANAAAAPPRARTGEGPEDSPATH
ncbi:PP2C family protein-serine/threonine phosphatase [Yinghuangia soli]|uniref:Serine/threonine-protein phosphatase n=1 Tax=Yinghuangia soli TaxID=2908204 RepID=A0AA41Q1Z9_9ACTN|nr:PP2C family serine/threonine-protein phosphatase [Yinghuangia soli]MCF2528612.1 serine/threonine-protein phosphatase [Yinghuangia soli]